MERRSVASSGPARRLAAGLAVFLAMAAPALAFDLRRARVERLPNGLTVAVLADASFPVVSVQVLYRAGARHESVGTTGVAHFLEHMAFRSSEGFPGFEIFTRIEDAGGEWHAYTWIDQTTYFATAPREHLDLLLAVEADRLGRLLLPAAEIEAERGAVLAELRGYAADPATVLRDAVTAASFALHPYRYNTIGWESDVRALGHADVAAFYRRHYLPANAVLAVVGDVDEEVVLGRVRELFGAFPSLPPPPEPATVEPRQRGERRLEVEAAAPRPLLDVAWHAPAVGDPDFPAFLLLQALAGGSGGVNFRQDDGQTPVREGSRLAGRAERTFFMPTAEPYLFVVSAGADPGASRQEVEAAIDEALAELRLRPVTAEELEAARRALADELVFDVETTEDAAHQLAFFAGLDALPVYLDLPARLAAVTPGDVRRVAARWLAPSRRTVGWLLPSAPPAETEATAPPAAPPPNETPRLVRLSGGLPAVFQRSAASPSAHLRAVVPITGPAPDLGPAGVEVEDDVPLLRQRSFGVRFRPADLRSAAERLRSVLAAGEPSPVFLAAVGDLDGEEALAVLEEVFGDLAPAPALPPAPVPRAGEECTAEPAGGQETVTWTLPAAGAGDGDFFAWQLLLYVLSHGYAGRFPAEAVGRRGLVYHVDSRYFYDHSAGFLELETGVDPARREALEEVFAATLDDLVRRPPRDAELAAARSHLLGRRRSAAQSNAELSAVLASDWAALGVLLDDAAYARRLAAVGRLDLERLAAVLGKSEESRRRCPPAD